MGRKKFVGIDTKTMSCCIMCTAFFFIDTKNESSLVWLAIIINFILVPFVSALASNIRFCSTFLYQTSRTPNEMREAGFESVDVSNIRCMLALRLQVFFATADSALCTYVCKVSPRVSAHQPIRIEITLFPGTYLGSQEKKGDLTYRAKSRRIQFFRRAGKWVEG